MNPNPNKQFKFSTPRILILFISLFLLITVIYPTSTGQLIKKTAIKAVDNSVFNQSSNDGLVINQPNPDWVVPYIDQELGFCLEYDSIYYQPDSFNSSDGVDRIGRGFNIAGGGPGAFVVLVTNTAFKTVEEWLSSKPAPVIAEDRVEELATIAKGYGPEFTSYRLQGSIGNEGYFVESYSIDGEWGNDHEMIYGPLKTSYHYVRIVSGKLYQIRFAGATYYPTEYNLGESDLAMVNSFKLSGESGFDHRNPSQICP
ncbi:MAG: hypothetical protein AAB833_00345 [Patescibacteria group bacterium]